MKELAIELRLRPAYVLGHLHLLWHAALEQQEDGDLSGWSDEFIAESADYPGDAPQFVRLLQQTGWLDTRIIHDWLDYSGRYLEAKYRTANPDKLRAILLKHPKSAFSRSKVGPDNQTLPNLTNQPTPPPGGFDLLWVKYPRREGKKEALRHYNASVLTFQDWLDINNALENYVEQLRINRTELKFTLQGKTWFNNWRDYVNYKVVASKVVRIPPVLAPSVVTPDVDLPQTPEEMQQMHDEKVLALGPCRAKDCPYCPKGTP